ncbi:MAG: EAL domain-containing protein [Wenzhouxiangellaceae bacterium]
MSAVCYLEGQPPGPVAGQRFNLEPLPALIGRQPDARVQIIAPSVSRLHAEIDRAPDGSLRIRDLGSTNGTFVNGRRVQRPEVILNGDVIHVGEIELRLVDTLGGVIADPGATTRIAVPVSEGTQPILIREFHELLDQRLVEAWRQPIVTADGQEFGAELLGRGTHPALTGAPAEMFALAARTGQEIRLSRLLREVSFESAARAGLQGPLFFNIHPLECDPPDDLLLQLGELRTRFPDLELVFEVHEKAITDLKRMASIRDELQSLNIALAYDDFGAGQARLQELVEVPPDYLKFDIGLIRGVLGPDSAKYRLLESLNRMIQAFGIKTLAEGIEDAATAATCREIGIDLYQGFHFARPEPIETV